MHSTHKNIVLIGMPGVGKTTIGKLLADGTGREFVDVDEYIEQQAGMSIPDMFAVSEEFFREREAAVIRELSTKGNLVIATGGGVIKIAANMQTLKNSGLVFFLNRSVDDILVDLDADYRPLLRDNPREKLAQLYQERYDKYLSCADYTIDCPLHRVDIAVDKIREIVAANN